MYFNYKENKQNPIICNVPHSSTKIPSEFLDEYVLPYPLLRQEALDMADLYTNLLYQDLLFVSSSSISDLSRIVVDTERFSNDEDEPMSNVGMSAFYTRTSTGEVLREISIQNRELLQKIYNEYHETFIRMVSSSLDTHGVAIIVDCHSFPSVARIYEPDQADNRPDICLGTDEYHTPVQLVELLQNNFKKAGYRVAINSPFTGTIVPSKYYHTEKKVISVMIEVNRKLYMNENTHEKFKDFSSISKRISRCVIQSLNEFYSSYEI